MASPDKPIRFLPSSTQFRTHPDALASQALGDDKLIAQPDESVDDEGPDPIELTLDSSDEEFEAAIDACYKRTDSPIEWALVEPDDHLAATCQLDSSWRLWDMFRKPRYDRAMSHAEMHVCAVARRTIPVRRLELLKPAWHVAPDDARHVPMTVGESGDVDWRWAKDSPSHVHADLVVNGVRVHIDRVAATKYGPGRSILEFRIHADGRLVGRGGRCGCSLGFGGDDLPAVGQVGRNLVIAVDGLSDRPPTVELWKVRRMTARRAKSAKVRKGRG